MKLLAGVTLLASSVLVVPVAQAAVINVFNDRATFLAALGGASTETQDFSGFSDFDDLTGVTFLPGVTATYSRGVVTGGPIVFGGGMFRIPFTPGNSSVFDLDIGSAYNAFGFDVGSFDPATPGPVGFEIRTADGTVQQISFVPSNPTELTPFFFGVIADDPLEHVLYGEGPETGGSDSGADFFARVNCCEETVLDDFVAARTIPEPGAFALLALGLLAAGSTRRFR